MTPEQSKFRLYAAFRIAQYFGIVDIPNLAYNKLKAD